jgi:hypothetical protein
MRCNIMPPRVIYHPNARLKTFGHNPGFHIIRPAPIPTCLLHNLDAAVKLVPAIRRRHLLLSAQNETRRSVSVGKL